MKRSFPVDYKYLRADGIIELTHREPVLLSEPQDFDDYFGQFLEYWRKMAGGQKVYALVNWGNFRINLRASNDYARNIASLYDRVVTAIVRYNPEDPELRTTGRLTSVRLHKPAHIYGTREEALAVIRGLRDGSVDVDSD
jgi:hypothetical protein